MFSPSKRISPTFRSLASLCSSQFSLRTHVRHFLSWFERINSRVTLPSRHLFYRTEFTCLEACTALDALLSVYAVSLFNLAGYCINRTFSRTKAAALALVLIYDISYQILTYAGGAAFFVNMGFIFVTEIPERTQYRVWSCLTETAQCR